VSAKTGKATGYRLLGSAAEDKVQGASVEARAVETLSFRSFEGERLHLWALTPAGYRVAGVELGLTLQVPRTDIGAQFAEHFLVLTDLVVQLLRPRLSTGS